MARSFSDTEYINLAHNADQFGMAAITWCCWFQRTGAGGASGDYFFGKPKSTNDGTWVFQISGSDFLRARIDVDTGITSITGTTALSDDTWYHAACRWDAAVDILYLFLDGAEHANQSVVGANIDNNVGQNGRSVFFGALTDSETDRFMAGPVCEGAMWDRGLSNAEIAAVYRYGVMSVPTSLVVYIPVNGHPTTELEIVNNRGTVSHTGSPAFAAHPPRIATVGGRSADTNLEYVASGAPPAGLSIPIAMHHYKLLRA